MKKYYLYSIIPITIGLAIGVWIWSLSTSFIHEPSTNSTSPILPEPTNQDTPNPVSLAALIAKDYNGSELKLGPVLDQNTAYTRYYITYLSGELPISGILNIPNGDGPFPALILNHGHIDTSIYTNGRGLKREQDYLTRAGYVVLHPDYRNHADSGKDNRDELAVRLSYAEDAINAIYALRDANLPNVDAERIGMLGHSMGGGVTLSSLVIRPELIDAAVLYAPVSGDMRESYERWISRRPEAAERVRELYGSPTTSPQFWDGISAELRYETITAPVQIFHGTADADVPLDWSYETEQLLRDASVDVTLTVYNNAPHEFISDWPAFMGSVKAFFDSRLQ